jgi:two-component system, cell cycle sensor histidine kinase and response regulator CckA
LFLLRGGTRFSSPGNDPAAAEFHLLLTAFLIWLVAYGVLIVPRLVLRKVVVAEVLLGLGAADLGALVLLHRGLKRAAAFLFFSVVWCACAGMSIFSGGLRSGSQYIACAIALSLGTGWLLRRSIAIAFAFASLSLALIEAFLEHIGHSFPDYFQTPPIGVLGTAVGMAVLTLVPLIAVLNTRRRQVSALHDSEERFHSLSNLALDGIMIHERGIILDANLAFVRLFGYERPEELIGRDGPEFMLTPESRLAIRQRIESKETGLIEVTCVRKDGSIFAAETETRPVRHMGREASLVACRDITARKEAEQARAKMQTQMYHAQKMESIGRLAGGVAHDFNNLLTVINGYSKLMLAEIRAGDPLHGYASEIVKSGERAAALTRQLLAFSRKQVLTPRSLDLNRLLREVRPMLDILVGPNVVLRVTLSAGSATVTADPNQLEQVVMNLVSNARDAMPSGGDLLIETATAEWKENNTPPDPDARLGRYVMLAVSDRGTGMDEATRRLMFEPFFTTKEVGKGTGLGLSMVHGIVAQSGGYIDVDSAPGVGTTIRIYLPELAEVAVDASREKGVRALGGTETVLVVDDQPEVVNFAAEALKAYGYRVIKAASGSEALLLCEQDLMQIDLVLTDAVMPNLSGWELADRLEKRRPGIKVLFMSGYTGDIVPPKGVLDNGTHFIQKPFSPETLAGKVRAVLGSSGRRQAPQDRG